jgi:hypothetical protein
MNDVWSKFGWKEKLYFAFVFCYISIMFLYIIRPITPDYPFEVASYIKDIAGVNRTVFLKVEEFDYCNFTLDKNQCQGVEAYAGVNAIVLKPSVRNSEFVIAHEMAHVRLFNDGLYNGTDHHNLDEFKCWERCLTWSWFAKTDLCGDCK